MWIIAYETKLFFSVPYQILGFLPLLLIDLKYQTLRLWVGNCSLSLIFPLVVTLSLDFCIAWMILRGMSILHAPWLYILTVQLFQHVHYLHICVVNQVVRTFLILWCWTHCLHGSPLSWNLLCHILFLFPQVLWWMMLFLLMSVIFPREIYFFLSYCVGILNHLRKKVLCIYVGFVSLWYWKR